ncbi:MAG: hypothetical protein KDC10_03400 [Calditrichaeota bacterium]|nr:hypothetical protein [Calditrichota bacterium]MCB9474229.1 hypothetical protein [Candidatus Delongbacteria bacterium]
MLHSPRTLILASLIALGASCPGVSALEVASRSWLRVEPAGTSVQLHLAQQGRDTAAAPALPADPVILVETRLSRLSLRDRTGRELPLEMHEIARTRTGRRVAIHLQADWLRQGLVLQESGEVLARPVARDSQGETDWAPHHLVRIRVDHDGFHAIGWQDLRDQLGSAGLADLPDPRLCSLVHDGVPQPIRITGEDDGRWDPGDRIEFHAQVSLQQDPGLGPDSRLNPYSDTEVYFLVSNGQPGYRMGQESGEVVETDPALYRTPLSFYHTEHYEQDLFHSQLGYVDNESQPDHFFWETNLRAGQLRSVDFHAPGLNTRSTQPVSLVLCLRGGSAPSTGDQPYYQRVQAYVNGSGSQVLDIGGEGDWINQELKVLEFGEEAFPSHTDFREDNVLTIAGVDLPPAGEFSNAMLNWFDVTYQRYYQAENDCLEFSVDSEYNNQLIYFNLTGFSSDRIQVYKLGQSRVNNLLIRPDTGGWRVAFQDVPAPGDRYLAIAEDAMDTPLSLELVEYHDLANTAIASDYLVIMADSLHRSGGESMLDPLLPQWSRIGAVRVISDAWIYDEFGDGRFSPFAIRDFLTYLELASSAPPSHVLLLGDGALTQRDAGRLGRPLLPVRFQQVYRWGAASTDDWYVAAENGISDGALLTRWPVNSLEQLANMVDKCLSYDEAEAGAWNNTIFLISADRQSEGDIFIRQREELIRQNVPADYFLRRLDVGFNDSRYNGLTSELRRIFDQGVVMANYFGHGGGAVWYDFNLLRSEDVITFDNAATLPLVTNTTCHIASIELEDALGKALLNSGPMGAIGVLGSSGLSFFQASMELLKLYYDYQLSNPDYEVSRALRLAEDQFRIDRLYNSSDSLNAEIAQTVITLTQYLGDPAQMLRLPRTLDVSLQGGASIQAGETLAFSGVSDLPDQPGRLEFYSATDHPQLTGQDFVEGVVHHDFSTDAAGNWQLQVPAPGDLYQSGLWGSARLLVGNDRTRHAGVRFFYADSLQQVWLSDALLEPEFPHEGEPIALWITAASPDPIDSLIAEVRSWAPGGDSSDVSRRMLPQDGAPTRFASQQDIGPFENGTRLRVLYVVHSAGESVTSNPTFFEVAPRLALVSSDWLGYGEDLGGKARLRLNNRGRGAADSLRIELRDAQGDALQSWWVPGLAAGESRDEDLALDHGLLGARLNLVVDPEGLVSDSDLAQSWELLADPLFVFDHGPDVAVVREVAPGLVLQFAHEPAPGCTEISLAHKAGLTSSTGPQPDLVEATPLLAFRRLGQGSLPTWNLEYSVSGSDTLGARELNAFVLDPLTGVAVREGAGNLTVSSLSGGLRIGFAAAGAGAILGRLSDGEPPIAEVSVQDQLFADGDHVPAQPVFGWLISDRNGIASASLTLSLDQVELDSDAITLQSTGDNGGLLVQVSPDFRDQPASSHQFVLEVADAAGNLLQKTTSFRVAGDFGLAYLGNYPNPFDRDTRFIYSLSGVADAVEVRIYTVSGRKVRTLRRGGPVINYDEIFWDGRDEEGDLVANGVYFYRFIARGDQGEISRLGKMARIKR